MWTLLMAGILLAQSTDFNERGVKALDAREYDAAIELFSKAIAADTTDYGAHFNLALAYSLAGKDLLAIPEYRKTLELKPGIFQAELNLGTSLFNTQQFADAAEAYTLALAANANSAQAELGLGRSLVRLARRSEAEPHYRKAVTLDASLREFLPELEQEVISQERAGVELLRSGKVAEAIPALEGAVAKSPTSANRLALAEAYAKSQQPAKAEPLVAQALAASPQDFEVRMFYARLLRDQKKLAQAADQFLGSAKLKPDSVEAWTELAGMLVLMEQFPQALGALDRVRALQGETAGHYFLRALAHEHLQQRKEALESYVKFLANSQGKNPDQEFQARQRVRILERDLGKR